MKAENWDKLICDLHDLFKDLGNVAAENFRYFCTKRKSANTDFKSSFESILNVLDPLQLSLDIIIKSCSRYDVSFCRGNGYRSLVYVTWKCMCKLYESSQNVHLNRDRLFFRSFHAYMELQSYTEVLCRLFTMVQFSIKLMNTSKPGCLFPNFVDEKDVLDVLKDFESVNRESFYGRSLGFQFSSTLKQSLQVIAVAMAAYGDGFDKHEHSGYRALYSFLHSGKYFVDPELRAKRVVDLTQNVSVDFCKEFWSLPEKHGIQHVPSIIGPTLAVSREFTVSAVPLCVQTLNEECLTVLVPSKNESHPQIKVHLMSYFWRNGQVETGSENIHKKSGIIPRQKSRNLIIHCHGGGFVAQSSKSHEIYLRNWAKELRAPILSINYSLSPDAVFPEALNECFYMYVWALENADYLGSTAEKICLVGDSAGANLVVSVCLKAIQENIRLPDGIVIAYPPFRVQYIPSPSRILSLMDPLLPVGILRECLEAYSGILKPDNLPKKSTIFRKSSSTYLGENYNAYDLDLGSSNFHRMSMTKSYSDTNLLCSKIESRRSFRQAFFASPSFQGPFNSFGTVGEDSLLTPSNSETTENKSDTMSVDSSCSGIEMHTVEENEFSEIQYTTGFSEREDTDISSEDCNTYLNDDRISRKNHTTDNLKCMSGKVNLNKEFEGTKERFWSRSKTFHFPRSRSESELAVIKRSKSCPLYCITNSIKDEIISSQDFISTLSEERTDLLNTTVCQGNSEEAIKEYCVHFIKSKALCNIIESKRLSKFETSKGHITTEVTNFSTQNDYSRKANPVAHQATVTETLLHTPMDPLMSPLFASDELLRKLPRISILACALDPLLDDSVEFTKRLHELGKEVDLYVIEDLPHGFLQFSIVSNEAKEASDLMIACMKQMFGIGMHRVQSFPPKS